MQASDPDKGRGTGFARGHFAIERLREIIVRVVVPPVAPVALLLHCAAGVTNGTRPTVSAITTQATVVVLDKVAVAYWRVTFRQRDSWASRLPGTGPLQLHTRLHRRRSNSPGTPQEIGGQTVLCRVGLDQPDVLWWSPLVRRNKRIDTTRMMMAIMLNATFMSDFPVYYSYFLG